VALARELYGRAGEVHVVSVGVGSLEVGEDLSPAVEGVVEDVIDTIAGLVRRAASTAERPVASVDHA
jgi:Ni,Fe-hydrogenase maturation factor